MIITLVVLVLLVAVGIPLLIAIPVFLGQRAKGLDTQAKSDLRNLATNEQTLLTDTGAYGSIEDIERGGAEVRVSPGVTVEVLGVDSSRAFCLSARHEDSSSYWIYDSASGGLLPAPQDDPPTIEDCTGPLSAPPSPSSKAG